MRWLYSIGFDFFVLFFSSGKRAGRSNSEKVIICTCVASDCSFYKLKTKRDPGEECIRHHGPSS